MTLTLLRDFNFTGGITEEKNWIVTTGHLPIFAMCYLPTLLGNHNGRGY